MIEGPLLIIHTDDDEGDRVLFEEALSRVPLATRLISLTGGEQLLNYLAAEIERPSVLFLDLNMPKISGFDCLTKIKETQNLQTLPVVICSTSGDENSVLQTFNSGAHLYLIKPFQFEKFTKIIHYTLELLADKDFVKPPLHGFVINNPGNF